MRSSWWIIDKPDVELGDDSLVPDVAGWTRDRLPKLPDVNPLTLPPDWVCEVLAPQTKLVDRVLKLHAYHRARVAHVWLVDPEAQLVEVLAWQARGWGYEVFGEGVMRAPPFEFLELDLARLWDRGETK